MQDCARRHPSIAKDSAMPGAFMDRWLAELGV
jgi:hypothetical protein